MGRSQPHIGLFYRDLRRAAITRKRNEKRRAAKARRKARKANMKDAEIKLRRTGNLFSFASSEFEVTYPDGYVGKVWSPPWHELSPDDEETAAREYAAKLFRDNQHKVTQ